MNFMLQKFCEEWLKNSSFYSSSDEDINAINKFFTRFIVYNNLYNQTNVYLIKNEKITSKQICDKRSATKNVPLYLGYTNLAQALKSNSETKAAIQEIVDSIKNKKFYIHIKKDKVTGKIEPEHQDDESSIKSIEGEDDQKFTESLLVLIYKTRCNLFHGDKQDTRYQAKLLDPMTLILEKVIDLLINQLKSENN